MTVKTQKGLDNFNIYFPGLFYKVAKVYPKRFYRYAYLPERNRKRCQKQQEAETKKIGSPVFYLKEKQHHGKNREEQAEHPIHLHVADKGKPVVKVVYFEQYAFGLVLLIAHFKPAYYTCNG